MLCHGLGTSPYLSRTRPCIDGGPAIEETLTLQLVRAFVAKINAHQADGLYELMTHDHRCVDAFGGAEAGRGVSRLAGVFHPGTGLPDRLRAGALWGDTIALFGTASGTVSQDGDVDPVQRWEVPAAWNVVVRGTRVAAWHVYMDTHPLSNIMAQGVRYRGRRSAPCRR